MAKRINHNNLLPWFTEDHGKLPASYLKSCQEFFDSICWPNYYGGGPDTKNKIFKLNKQQAASFKPQATSDKLTQRQTKKES